MTTTIGVAVGEQGHEDRLAALEFLRQVMYDYDPAADQLQKVLDVAQLGAR